MRRITFLFLFTLLYGGASMAAMQLTSTAFNNGDKIPAQYGCHGANISPPLAWHNAPEKTISFVLIVDDPDAPMGTWEHWILFNLPAKTTAIEENLQILPPGTRVGSNTWKQMRYGGPCPPDKTHRYYFKLYALDIALDLSAGVDKKTIEKAMEGHILETTVLMGTYPTRG